MVDSIMSSMSDIHVRADVHTLGAGPIFLAVANMYNTRLKMMLVRLLRPPRYSDLDRERLDERFGEPERERLRLALR